MKLVILLATIACAFTVHANEAAAPAAGTEVSATAEKATVKGHEMGKKAHKKMKTMKKDAATAVEGAAVEGAKEETH
jgi:hypothetical protein